MMPRAPPFLGGTAGPIVDVDTTAATTTTSTTASGSGSGSGSAAAASHANALLQQRVRVKWKGTGRSQWYSGRIVAYDARKRVHTVVYDDGETHAHHLGDLVWQTLPEHTSSVGSAASSPAAGRGKGGAGGAAGGAGRGAGGTPDSLDGHLGTVGGRDLYQEHTDEGYMSIISSPACTESQATISDTGSGSGSGSESDGDGDSGGGAAAADAAAAAAAAAGRAPPAAVAPPVPPRAPSAENWKEVADSEPVAEFTPVHPPVVAQSLPPSAADDALHFDDDFELVNAADAVEVAALAAQVEGAQIE